MRNAIIAQIIFVTLAFVDISVYGQTGSIRGRVFNSDNNEPLPFVNIVVFGTNIGSTSDFDGNFLFTGIEPGFIRLSASFVGFEQFITGEFMVSPTRIATIEIPMNPTILELEEVEVRASVFRRQDESPVSMRTLGIAELEKNPGGNRDISRVIQSLPGVGSTVSFRNDLIVRGGGPNENSFFIDGMEIPNLNHFATQGASGGPVGIVNIDFIREVDLYSGAFPANRGNALSSILEMRFIDGNQEQLNFRGSVGASDLALTLDGPVGDRASFIFSARRSYLQFLFSALGLPFLPTYNSFQGKYRINFNQQNQLTILGIGALDQFSLNTGIENPDVFQQYILDFVPVNEQWNYAIGGVYRHFRPNGSHTMVLSRNMLRNKTFKYFDNIEIPENLILNSDSDEIENKLRYEYLINQNGTQITAGAGLEYAKYLNNTFQQRFTQGELSVVDYNSYIDLFKWSLFVQANRAFVNDRLRLSLGLRTDANNYSKSMSNMLNQLSPRLSASWAFNPNMFLNFNTGRYFQHPPYTTLGFRNNSGVLVNKVNNLKYIVSDHVVVGLEYKRNPNAQLSVEGFYKYYRNYPFSLTDSIAIASKGADFGTFGDEEVISRSNGRAYGFELLWRERNLAGFNIIASYTYVRSSFEDYNGKMIPSAWDNRHLFNITATRSFERNWDIGAKWRFVGGAPFTPFDLEKSANVDAWNTRGRAFLDFSQFNTLRFDPAHQLDIRIDKQYFFDRWSLLLYLDVQNIYNFRPADNQIVVRETDANGNFIIENGKYRLRKITNQSGNILPTIGIIVEI